jgi:hypothetical protein
LGKFSAFDSDLEEAKVEAMDEAWMQPDNYRETVIPR